MYLNNSEFEARLIEPVQCSAPYSWDKGHKAVVVSQYIYIINLSNKSSVGGGGGGATPCQEKS